MRPALPRPTPQKAINLLAMLLALAVAIGFAWRLAGWTWLVAAPAAPVVAPDLRGDINLALIASRPWFGTRTAPAAADTAAAPAASQSSGVVIRLIGVFAGGKRPVALIGAGGKAPAPFAEGETIAPGITLKSVAKDHVVVTHDGLQERVDLPVKPGAELKKPEEKRSSE